MIQLPKFGRLPKKKPFNQTKPINYFNYASSQFENIHFTDIELSQPFIDEDAYRHSFRNRQARPLKPILAYHDSLLALREQGNSVTWLGHSSVMLCLEKIIFLVDPIFSNYASPLPGVITAFAGTPHYQSRDFPTIDYVLITHDHWDHLDYRTINMLQHKVNYFIVGLGVGEHLAYWGISKHRIIEKAWFDEYSLPIGKLRILPAKHFSGRSLKRNRTLWVSFRLELPSVTIYLSGDSGYGDHFKEIYRRYGPVDLAILENGQYNLYWKNYHMFPEQTYQAAKDLHAVSMMPIHMGKFKLSTHPWNEPIDKLYRLSQQGSIKLLTPPMGKVMRLDEAQANNQRWWLGEE